MKLDDDLVKRKQLIFDQAYPEACKACGAKNQYTDIRNDDKNRIRFWYCTRCGTNKGAAIASPLEVKMAYDAHARKTQGKTSDTASKASNGVMSGHETSETFGIGLSNPDP